MNISLKAMYDGMRAASPAAELIAWFYCPQTEKHAPWVQESTSKIPEGVIPQFNFESGGKKYQLGKIHYGGDYWVSCIGPSDCYREAAAANPVKDLSAKLQLSVGHEFTVVSYIPAPGIAYRKYRAMHELGVNSVTQSWTIGNFPGLLTNAMGRLCTEDFKGSEEEFLLSLAKIFWHDDATVLVRARQNFCKGYLNFPFTLLFQYYGPPNSFVNWKFFFLPELQPLSMPWKPNYPASGDTIGEALGDFTLEEILRLLEKFNSCWRKGEKLLAPLREKYISDRERFRDIQVAEAVGICFAGTENLVRFYLLRCRWFTAGDREALKEMLGIVEMQKKLYRRLLPILENDSRIGFHGEALTRIFDEHKGREAITAADASLKVGSQLLASSAAPLEAVRSRGILRECPLGTWHEAPVFRWKCEIKNGRAEIRIEPHKDVNVSGLKFMWIDCCGTKLPLWELFGVTDGKLCYKGNHYASVTGKRYLSGVKYSVRQGTYCVSWPLGALPQ